MKVVFSEEYRRRLFEIVEYIAEDSPERAKVFADSVEAKAMRLRRFPLMGRTVPELGGPYKELLIGDYRLVYRIHGTEVHVLTVFHGMRQFPFSA